MLIVLGIESECVRWRKIIKFNFITHFTHIKKIKSKALFIDFFLKERNEFIHVKEKICVKVLFYFLLFLLLSGELLVPIQSKNKCKKKREPI